jgi:hypothetical protein
MSQPCEGADCARVEGADVRDDIRTFNQNLTGPKDASSMFIRGVAPTTASQRHCIAERIRMSHNSPYV